MRRDVFQAIADPIRREIIQVLAEAPLTVNAVAERFEISRPAVSKHLKILEECGIVIIHQQGRERFCQIQPSSLIPAFMWIDQYRKLWEARLDSFEEYLNELQQSKEPTEDNQVNTNQLKTNKKEDE
ncbi:transcriptional regulator [marine bacterium AO1-C]|nr:transcriptional regulator [marine bacterium AO1-C]